MAFMQDRSKFVLPILITLALVAGCAKKSATSRDESIEHRILEQGGIDYSKNSDLSSESIYQLQSTWRNQNGQIVNLADLRGKTEVFAFIYTNCKTICPKIVSDLQIIEKDMGRDNKSKVGFVLISIDPDRDSPDQLKAFAKKHHLDQKSWLLLNGTKPTVLELTAFLGFKYKEEANGDFTHPYLILVIDQDGIIKYQQTGPSQNPKSTIQAIKDTFKHAK